MRRLFVVLMLAGALVAGCGGTTGKAPVLPEGSTRLKVATSIYPMYEFTKQVAGDKIDLVNLVTAGTEPHDWEPSPGHIKALNKAQVFIYNGLGIEHWVEKTVRSLDNKGLVILEASSGIAPMKGEGDEVDPHVWLDPQKAIRQVEAIRAALAEADPANKAAYEAGAHNYVEQLRALDQAFTSGLTGCKRKEFFTSHAAFGYLADRYGLQQHPIMGLSPDAEPKPKELAQIAADARAKGVKHIFFETLVADKVAKALAREIGAGTLLLNPLEGLTDQEVKDGKSFVSVMQQNLANLKIALECGK